MPQELRLRGIGTIEAANQFLRERYIAEFNGMFAKPAREKGTAFRKCDRKGLDQVFSIQTERMVAKDNTIAIRDRHWQLDRTPFRHTLADCRATVCEQLNGTLSVRWGPHVVGLFDAEGRPLKDKPGKRRTEMRPKRTASGSKEMDRPFPFPLRGNPGPAGSSHAGSTLRASKKHWHASMQPAPPAEGSRPLVNPPPGCADHRSAKLGSWASNI